MYLATSLILSLLVFDMFSEYLFVLVLNTHVFQPYGALHSHNCIKFCRLLISVSGAK